MDVYELVRGPFAWIAFVTFTLGSLYRIIFLLLTGKGNRRRIIRKVQPTLPDPSCMACFRLDPPTCENSRYSLSLPFYFTFA